VWAVVSVAFAPGLAFADDAGARARGVDVAAAIRALEETGGASSEDLERALRAARKESRDPSLGLSRLDPGEPGVHDAAVIVSTMRTLASAGSTEAVRALARAAVLHDGLFRGEASELLSNLGERANAGLILEWRLGATAAVRRFAGAQLEAMERSMPGEAIQTKSPEVLADVLRAYGTAKDMDALGVVLSFSNADRVVPREASRLALIDYGASATTKLREAYASFMNRSAPDDWAPERLARELFAAYDRDRRKEMYVLLDDGLAVLRRAREKTPPDPALLAQAVEAFDKILARAPSLERRSEMVPAYVLLAQSVEGAEGERASLLYRRAADLDPASPRMPQIQAGLLALEARALRARGVNDEEGLRRAIALDPANAMARAELSAIEEARAARTDRVVGLGWIGAGLAGAGIVIFLALALRRRLAG
jgi:hypothetical protein